MEGPAWRCEPLAMAEVVWIAAWELQCYGTPFSVGDAVSWRIHAVPGPTSLSPSDAEGIGPVAWAYDHHSDDVDVPTTATVTTIRAVYQRYEVDGRTSADPHGRPRGRHLIPIPATMVAESRDHADGWERDRGDVRFVGYAVHVELDRAPDERTVERRSPRPGLL